MPPETIPQYFGKDLEAMSFARNYHRWILAELRPFLGETVAEVGAGVGSFSELVLATGVRSLHAFEPSANMFARLAAALGSEPRAQAINDFFGRSWAGAGFDSVLYVNVLEHIEDDAAELLAARAALRPGGHLLLFVPALRWLYSDLDRQVGHYRRYHKRELVELTRSSGFEIVKARHFDIAGILPWYVSFVLLKNSIGGGSVALYDRLVVPVMRRVERVIRPPIGKNILLVAKKAA